MIADLFPRSAAGFKLGLEQMRALMDRLGQPQERYRCAIVAGTNGKGSTASALADALGRSRRRVGLYTSPHLMRFSERFRIDGQELAPEVLVPLYERVKEADRARVAEAPEARPATFFELGTAMAFLAFVEAGVDDGVLEVGLGGRLDATNIVNRAVAVITPIGFDHQRYLGNTLAAIAGEKAGVIQPGVPVVMGPQEPEAREVILRAAHERGSPVHAVTEETPRGSSDTVEYRSAPIILAARTAAVAARLLGVDAASIEAMSRSQRWHPPARYQWLDREPPVLLDAAHNRPALEALGASVRRDPRIGSRPVHGIFNVLDDRPLLELLGTLAPWLRSLTVPRLPTPRGCDPALVPGRLAHRTESVRDALERATDHARADGGIVLIAGSFQLLAEALQVLTGEPRDPPVRG